MLRFCKCFNFWNGYVRKENQRYEPSCPKVGGLEPPQPSPCAAPGSTGSNDRFPLPTCPFAVDRSVPALTRGLVYCNTWLTRSYPRRRRRRRGLWIPPGERRGIPRPRTAPSLSRPSRSWIKERGMGKNFERGEGRDRVETNSSIWGLEYTSTFRLERYLKCWPTGGKFVW